MQNWKKGNKVLTDVSQMPKGCIGFIYKITTSTGKSYIGRKQIISVRKRKFGKREIAKLTDSRLKKYEMVTKESDWKSYTGSSKPLNIDIKKGVKYKKEILKYCFNKKQLTYYETKYQMIDGAIEPGNNSYVGSVGGRFFPKDLKND